MTTYDQKLSMKMIARTWTIEKQIEKHVDFRPKNSQSCHCRPLMTHMQVLGTMYFQPEDGIFSALSHSYYIGHQSRLKFALEDLTYTIFVEPIRSRLAFILSSRFNEWPDRIFPFFQKTLSGFHIRP